MTNLFYRLGFLTGRCKYEYARGFQNGFAEDANKANAAKLSQVEAQCLADPRDRVKAVKLHRQIYNSSLKDALDAVNEIQYKLGQRSSPGRDGETR
jgi:hypothetical protein